MKIYPLLNRNPRLHWGILISSLVSMHLPSYWVMIIRLHNIKSSDIYEL